MHRVEKPDGTPKKRLPDGDESIVSKEATTKSGRKVKRPTFLDSPERTSAPPSTDGRKSVARKVKPAVETADDPVKSSPARRVMSNREETAGGMEVSRKAIGSAKKTVASLADTPKKILAKEANEKSQPEAVEDNLISKSGRKLKVPAKLIDFESEILTSPRKATASISDHSKENPQEVTKTRGRPSRSVKKQTVDDDTVQQAEEEPVRSRAVRGKSVASNDGGRPTPSKTIASTVVDAKDSSSRTGIASPAPPKTTGRRAKSVATGRTEATAPQNENDNGILKTTRTPGRAAAKSVLKMRPDSPEIMMSSKLSSRKTAPPKSEETEGEKLLTPVSSKTARTPGRPAAHSLIKQRLDSPAVSSKPIVRIVRSIVPMKPVADSIAEPEKETKAADKTATRTPGRRAVKSLLLSAEDSSLANKDRGKSEQLTEDDPPLSSTTAEGLDRSGKGVEALSRSGRKLKPKKIFELEQDESSGKQQHIDEEKGADRPGGRKRKMDNADESKNQVVAMVSPRKKTLTEKVVVLTEPDQCPKQPSEDTDTAGVEPFAKLVLKKATKTVEKSSNAVAMIKTPSKDVPHANEPEGLVSRSGRKIKAKKMFGFEDGDVFDLSIGSVTSPSKGSRVDIKDHRENLEKSTKSDTKSSEKFNQPEAKNLEKLTKSDTKKAFSSVKSADDVTDETEKHETDKTELNLDQFVTKRGLDDHHSKPQLAATDEPDRAAETVIQMSDISFPHPISSPKKRAIGARGNSLARINTDSDSPQNQAISIETVGSSRSGRKIKPKKFFGDDDDNVATNPIVKERKSVTVVASATSSTSVHEEQPEKPPAIETPTEEKTLDAHSVVVCQTIEKNMMSIDTETGVDIAEGPAVASTPTDIKDTNITVPIAEKAGMQSSEDVNKGNVDMEPAGMEQEGNDVVEGPTPSGKPSDDNPSNVDCDSTTDGEKVDDVEPQSDARVPAPSEPTEVAIIAGNVLNVETMQKDCSQTVEDDGATTVQNGTSSNAIGAVGTPVAAIDDAINPVAHSTDAQQQVEQTSGDLEKHNLSGESTIVELKADDDDLLADGSFGEIEYLEDEEPNVVEHIRKMSSHAVYEEAHEHGIVPSITIIPETPCNNERRPQMDETYSPLSTSAVLIDITADTPQAAPQQIHARPAQAAAAPRTPDSKASERNEHHKCSPDKPPEIIEIIDSPAAMAFCQQIDNAANEMAVEGGGSATSTPLPIKTENLAKEGVVGKLLYEGRKRSLSASAVDTTMKRNVTFHSPANCTVLVDTIDERLMMKSLLQKPAEIGKVVPQRNGPRKRSLSEHKATQDEVKPSKISRKVPNFRNIHANHFDRMESIADFMKRKEHRARDILTSASPATKLLARPAGGMAVAETDDGTSTQKKTLVQKPFVFKSGGSNIPLFGKATTTAVPQQRLLQKGSNIARPVLTAASRAAVAAAQKRKVVNPHNTTDDRLANRLQQYQAAFKPKQQATNVTSTTTMNATTSAQRPVEQLRSKRSKVLKGVRTNRRFELQMKHRDNLQHP